MINTNKGVIHYFNDQNINSEQDAIELFTGLSILDVDNPVFDYYEVMEVLEEAKYISSGIIEEQG
jgi:hypothetical protein